MSRPWTALVTFGITFIAGCSSDLIWWQSDPMTRVVRMLANSL